MSTGALIAFRLDRLGARLISLVNALRIGETCNLPVRMHWHEAAGVGSEFNEPEAIFAAAFMDAHFIGASDWRRQRDGLLKLQQVAHLTPAAFAARVKNGESIMVSMAFGVFNFATEDAASVREAAGRIFHSLPLAAELTPLKERLAGTLRGAVAYHIRRGDLISDIKAMNRAWPHKYVPEPFYRAHMDEMQRAGRKMILFSDEARTIQSFKSDFPDLMTADDLFDATPLQQGARDFMELFAMSCCGQIIAPQASAFSSTASELGGVPISDVKSNLSDHTYTACCETLLTAFRSDPEALGDIGEQGQILVHLDQFLSSQGRMTEARDLYVQKTMHEQAPLSYLYPRTLELLLRTEDRARAIAFVDSMASYPIYHRMDQMRTLLLKATALAESGQQDAALGTLHLMLWTDAEHGLLRRLPHLIRSGALTDQNFFPVSVDVMFRVGRNMNNSGKEMERRCFSAISGTNAASMQGSDRAFGKFALLDPLLWDWGPLIGNPISSKQPLRTQGQELITHLKTEAPEDNQLSVRSTLALIEALTGNAAAAAEDLDATARTDKADALVLLRLSRAKLIARDRRGAIAAATAACSLSSSPAFHFWEAHCLKFGRKPDCERALDRLDTLETSVWAASPGFWSLRSSIETKLGDHKAAMTSGKTAWDIAPQNSGLAFQYSTLLVANGANSAASKILEGLFFKKRLQPKAVPRLIELLLEDQQTERAVAVFESFAEQKPEMAEDIGRALPALQLHRASMGH